MARFFHGSHAQQERDNGVDVRVGQLPPQLGIFSGGVGPFGSFFPAGFPFRITPWIE